MKNNLLKRVELLSKLLNNNDQAILITNDINIGFFTNFYNSEGYFLLTKNQATLFVDFRYYESAKNKAQNCNVVCYKNFLSELTNILKSESIKNIHIEISDVKIDFYKKLEKIFNEQNIACYCNCELDKKINDIRIIKDESEIKKIQIAQNIAEKAYLDVLNYIKVGVSEKKIAIELEYLMKKYGAEEESFKTIAITGKKTSLPHGVPSDDIVKYGDFFTMDFGATYQGYHSDTTRTVGVGDVSDYQKEIYSIVLDAQLSALKQVKDGVLASAVDKTARDIITLAGYGKNFGHSTGHGVGLQIHELPFVSPKSEFVLKEGMIITDEPGIYIENKFGVRIEDMLCVTKNGYFNFVNLPKELIIL